MMDTAVSLFTFSALLVLVVIFIALPKADRIIGRMLGRRGTGNPDAPYRIPPPPWHGQHAEGCPARAGYDKRTKPRVKVCGCCGKRITHPTPKPPRTRRGP